MTHHHRWIVALGLMLGAMLTLPEAARAQGCGTQNPNCIVPTAPAGTSNNQAASTKFVQTAVAGAGMLPLPSAQIYVGNVSGTAAAVAMSGDCTISNTGAIICTKTNGVAFAPSATTDATNASNIGSGSLNTLRLPAPFTSGTAAGNTSKFATVSGSTTSTHCANFDASGNVVDSGATCSGSIVGSNNTWTGTNIWNAVSSFFNTVFFYANAFFSGTPFFDVRSNGNSCAAADNTGATDSTTAIQCHLNYMSSTYGGGIVHVSCGIYLVSSNGPIIPANVWLEGDGLCSIIFVNTDSAVIRFGIGGVTTCPSGNHNGGFEKLNIAGYNTSPVNVAVFIGNLCNVTIRDSKIIGGSYGLDNAGVDSLIENNFIWGYTGALLSSGANWYLRDKFDQPAGTGSTYGYNQQPNVSGLTLAENFFVMCDFSGTYTASVNIADGGNTSITHFTQSVFSSPIVIATSRMVMFDSVEVGSTSFSISNGNMGMVGSYAFSATTVTGAGARSCAGNTNLTC